MKLFISLMLAFALCLSLCACGEKATPEMIEAYNNANACLTQERYEDAARLYLQAGDYEDSQQKLLDIYYYAVNLFEKGNSDEAISLFTILAEANINDSATYVNTTLFQEAMDNARFRFEEALDADTAREWLNTASQYATDVQKKEIADYEALIERKLYYKGTQFIALPYYLADTYQYIPKDRVSGYIEDKIDSGLFEHRFVVNEGEGYTSYRYKVSSQTMDDAKQYVENYLQNNFGLERMLINMPAFTSGDFVESVGFDDSRYAIFVMFWYDAVEVYVVQPEYVDLYLG